MDLSDGSRVRTFSVGPPGTRRATDEINSIDVTSQRLYAITRSNKVFVYDLEGNRQTTDEPSGGTVSGTAEIAVNDTTIYVRGDTSGTTITYRAYTLTWVRDEEKDVSVTAPSGFSGCSRCRCNGYALLLARCRQ